MNSEDEFGVGGPLELNEANVVAVQDQLKAEIDSLKKWLDECGQQGADHSADVVNEVQFACKQSTLLLREFDEAVRQYQAARRDNRPLSPDDISKFEQFGFIVPEAIASPVPSTPARSRPQQQPDVSPRVADALREELESVRQKVTDETSVSKSESPFRDSTSVSAHSPGSEASAGGWSAAAAMEQAKQEKSLADTGRPPIPSRRSPDAAVASSSLRSPSIEPLENAGKSKAEGDAVDVVLSASNAEGADPRLAGALQELVSAHEFLRTENQQLLHVAEGALSEVFRVLQDTNSTELSSTGSIEKLTEAIQSARSTPSTPAAPGKRSPATGRRSPSPSRSPVRDPKPAPPSTPSKLPPSTPSKASGGSEQETQQLSKQQAHVISEQHEAIRKLQAEQLMTAADHASQVHQMEALLAEHAEQSAVLAIARAEQLQDNRQMQQAQADREDLLHALSEKDYLIEQLKEQHSKELQRQAHVESEARLSKAQGDSALIEQLSALKEDMDQVGHLYELSKKEIGVLECSIAECKLREAAALSGMESESEKDRMLQMVHNIARDENMLLRSVIEQLKQEISRRGELYFQQLEQGKAELHRARGLAERVEPAQRLTENQIEDFEQEVVRLCRDWTHQDSRFIADPPHDPLQQAVAKVVRKVEEKCPVPVHIVRESQGEYFVDQQLSLSLLSTGDVMARYATGSESLQTYLEKLYLPFITDVSKFTSPLLMPRRSPAAGSLDGFEELTETTSKPRGADDLQQRSGYAGHGGPKRLNQRIHHPPALHHTPIRSSPLHSSPYDHSGDLSSQEPSPSRSPPRRPPASPPRSASPLGVSASPPLSSPAWSVSSAASSMQRSPQLDLEPSRMLPASSLHGSSSMHSFLFNQQLDDSAEQEPLDHKSPPISGAKKRLITATPKRNATSRNQREQPVKSRPGRSDGSKTASASEEEIVRVRALKKFALRKQIEENRRERENAKKR